MKLQANIEHIGMIDYWSGNGDRWNANAGCLFASYGANTTLPELIDALVYSYCNDGEFDDKEPFNDVSPEMVKRFLIDEFLTDDGRADYKANAPAIKDYAEYNEPCDYEDDEGYCDCCESPQVVLLLKVLEG